MSPRARIVPDGRPRIVPSILSADFGALRESISAIPAAELEWASVDVMDGHFVPNLSFGPDVVAPLRKDRPELLLDAHLMVTDPARFAPIFARSADWVTFHLEACKEPRPLLKELRAAGVGAGLAVKPGTPAKALLPFLADIDLALVMTVEPGFGGQGFLADMLPKVRELRAAIDRAGLPCWLQVDGGISAKTVAAAAEAGADSLVAGSAVFKAPDPAKAFREIRDLAEKNFVRRAASRAT
ncbi:MAG TPA: ribulose-phosphate 3-epimerase [Elusimicrobiota bacterium]|nr:ribulose-phosphate 3-epimerase [Elusimicrobiota bacterium]